MKKNQLVALAEDAGILGNEGVTDEVVLKTSGLNGFNRSLDQCVSGSPLQLSWACRFLEVLISNQINVDRAVVDLAVSRCVDIWHRVPSPMCLHMYRFLLKIDFENNGRKHVVISGFYSKFPSIRTLALMNAESSFDVDYVEGLVTFRDDMYFVESGMASRMAVYVLRNQAFGILENCFIKKAIRKSTHSENIEDYMVSFFDWEPLELELTKKEIWV
jgi:hypothetical protein